MTNPYALAEILQEIESNPAWKALFTGEQLTKYRVIADRLAENRAVRPFRVVFCGVFSSGKTSLINSLLHADFQLPEGVNPVTKKVTRIQSGSSVTCTYQQNGRRVSVPKEHIAGLISGKKQLVFESSELTVTIPSEALKSRVELLDTPGFNDEMGGALEEMSRKAIYEADMAVLCCNALQLGKILEKELVQELEELIGHFCLVVTRMDNLNTTEDCNAVIDRANKLMAHKGNAASVFISGQSFVFPVVAVGTYKHTDEFEHYFKAILDDEVMKDRIQAVSDEKCLTRCLHEIQPFFDEMTRQQREELSALLKQNNDAIRQQELQAQTTRSKLINTRQEANRVAAQIAEKHMRALADYILRLRDPLYFQANANQQTHSMINTLINDIASYSEREHIASYLHVQTALGREYLSLNFSVPPPVKTKVLRRGALSRTVHTINNFASFNFHVDDGCDQAYAGYQEPAIQAIWNGPVAWVLRAWDLYLERLGGSVRLAGFSGGWEQAIQSREESLRRCEAVRNKILSCYP